MKPDFNPLDLSAPVKPPEPQPQVIPMQVTVHKVGMGPLLHSRFIKVLVIVLALVLTGLLSYIGTDYYLSRNNNAVLQGEAKTTETPSTIQNNTSDKNQATNNNQTGEQNSNTQTPTGGSASETKTYCGVSGMPEGVCTAITSVEKDGLKDNKYVSADTSSLPKGTSVSVDKQSWKQGGPELGSVNFTAKYLTKTYSGTAFLQIVNGTWKVISYTLNQ